MKVKKNTASLVITIAGLALLAVGLYLAKTVSSPGDFMKAFPFVCVGVGCGAFGQGMGALISSRAAQKHPEFQKQMEINLKDERNVAIVSRAKAKAYDVMVFVFGALLLAFALMGVEMTVILLLVFAYLVVVGSGVYYRVKYDKEM